MAASAKDATGDCGGHQGLAGVFGTAGQLQTCHTGPQGQDDQQAQLGDESADVAECSQGPEPGANAALDCHQRRARKPLIILGQTGGTAWLSP